MPILLVRKTRNIATIANPVSAATGQVDLDEVRAIALKHRPKILFCGGTAVPRTVDFPGFRAIADEVDAILVADVAHISGLIAGGAHPSPVGYADVISTTTHKTLRGPRGALLMANEEFGTALDRAVFPGLQGGPHNGTTAGIAVALHEASGDSFKAYAADIVTNAKALGAALMLRGFRLVSGGTDNHLLLLDLSNANIGGKPVAQALDRAGLTVNYNTVPFDKRSPFSPSGIRIGTAAVTTRGLGVEHMEVIADWMSRSVLAAGDGDEQTLSEIKRNVRDLARQYPVPGINTN